MYKWTTRSLTVTTLLAKERTKMHNVWVMQIELTVRSFKNPRQRLFTSGTQCLWLVRVAHNVSASSAPHLIGFEPFECRFGGSNATWLILTPTIMSDSQLIIQGAAGSYTGFTIVTGLQLMIWSESVASSSKLLSIVLNFGQESAPIERICPADELSVFIFSREMIVALTLLLTAYGPSSQWILYSATLQPTVEQPIGRR